MPYKFNESRRHKVPNASHAAPRATRFEALEPIRQGVREHFGGFANNIAGGLSILHDHGSQYMSDAFQKKLDFLGAESSPAFVRPPEGNGCAERFIRTLKENLLWVQTFDTVDSDKRCSPFAKPTTQLGSSSDTASSHPQRSDGNSFNPRRS